MFLSCPPVIVLILDPFSAFVEIGWWGENKKTVADFSQVLGKSLILTSF
jgi:hypothetical protein